MNQAALNRPLKKLLDHWAELETQWRDARAHEFHQTYLLDLPHSVQVVGHNVLQLQAVLQQIKNECE